MIVLKLLFVASTVPGFAFAGVHGEAKLPKKFDYIDLGITEGLGTTLYDQDPSAEIVVEIALVADKAWGDQDQFRHDRQKILDYWAVHFYDVNLRYQTLPSVNISIRVTSITTMANTADQPFIEESRVANGAVSFRQALPKFGDWIAAQLERNAIPKYDVAILVTNEKTEEGYGGLAFLSLACSPNRAVAIHIDDAKYGGGHVASHELAHVLGAGHDSDYDWCTERPGFIMAGDDDINTQYFFSSCSDRLISDFVKTDRAACLRRIDEPGTPPIEPKSASVTPPSILEQCKILVNDPNAVLGADQDGKCQNILCWRSPANGGSGVRIKVVDNTVCYGGGRCFRGRCLRRGYKLINVATRECIQGVNRFMGKDSARMEPCPQYPSPMQKVSFANYTQGYGPFLSTPYSNTNATESTDKCLWTGQGEGHEVGYDTCTRGHVPSYEWDLEFTDYQEQYLLVHIHTGKCAKQVGNVVKTYQNCDKNDPYMRWSFHSEIQ